MQNKLAADSPTSRLDQQLARYPNLQKMVTRQLELTPQHEPFFIRRFGQATADDLASCDSLAHEIALLSGSKYDEFLLSYDFICKIQRDEEIYFRRNKSYRLKNFQEAIDTVYSNRPYMQQYMRGLLVTQVYWSNHTASIGFYAKDFLGGNPAGYELLEIGPGHGLLLARAISDQRAGRVTGWDLSQASLSETREALAALGLKDGFALEERNLFDAPKDASFDAVVFSEVLEHLEEPERALKAIRKVVRPGGRLFVNVPINSPAPDHIFLLKSPEEAVAFVEQFGFKVERTGFFPATNYTLEQSRKHALTISVCLIARAV